MIILSIQNVDALEDINKTIQINDNYKQRFDLEKGDILSLNLTTTNYVDIFFLSEQGLIDYELNKLAKPSHENWYKLNTTSFSENLTIDSSGLYFLLVDSKKTPDTNKTLDINEIFDVKKQQIQVKNVSLIRKIGGGLLVIILFIIFPLVIILGRKIGRLAEIIFIYIALLGLGIIIADIPLFVGDINQEFNLLSTLTQSLAGLLAITVSINFVIFQVSSQVYTSATFKLFIRNPSFIQFVSLNLMLIGLLVFSMSNINYSNNYFEIGGILLFRYIDILIIFFILAISLVIPYIYETMQLMKPAVVIDLLGKDVKKKDLLNSSRIRRNLNIELDSEIKQKSLKLNKFINYFNNILPNIFTPNKNVLFDSDGLQALRNIANKAINDSNYELLRITSKELEALGRDYVLDTKIPIEEKVIIAEHFGYHLYKIAETAVIKKDLATITSIVGTLLEINKASEKDSLSYETITYIGKIGRKCASDRLENNAYDVIDSLGELGKSFASKEWVKSTDITLNEINAISEELIQNELLITRSKSIMSSFYGIAKKAVEKQLDFQIMSALMKSQMIADRIMKYKKNILVSPKEQQSFLQILEEVGTKINSEMPLSIGILSTIIDDVGKTVENTHDSEFIKKLTRTLIVIGINLSKQNMTKDNVLKVLTMLNNKNPSVKNEWDEVEKKINLTDKNFFDKFKLEFLKSLPQNKNKSRGIANMYRYW